MDSLNRKSRFPTLTSWRGLMAIAIVLYHLKLGGLFNQASYFIVSFFFISSGFLLTVKNPTTDGIRWRTFVGRRALLIFPLHWLTLAVMLLAQWAEGSPPPAGTIALNALLLHAWVPVREVFFSLNAPSWFLSALMFCYVCYLPLRKWLDRIQLQDQALLPMAIGGIFYWQLYGVSEQVATYVYVCPAARLVDFLLGIVLANLLRALPDRYLPSRRHATIIEVSVVALAVGLMAAIHRFKVLDNWSTVFCWLPMALLVVTCAVFNGREGMLGRLLRWRPLMWLGTLCFEIYMLESCLLAGYMRIVSPVLGHYGVSWAYHLPVAVNLALLVALAWLVHRYLTVPLRRLANKLRPAPTGQNRQK